MDDDSTDRSEKSDDANGIFRDFCEAIRIFLTQTGMSSTRLGTEALGDPTFMHHLMKGRIPRIDTADRLLAYMGEPPKGPVFLREVEAFLEVTRTKPYLLGLEATGNPSFVTHLRQGRMPRLTTVGQVRAWMNSQCSPSENGVIRAMADKQEIPD